MASPYSFYYHLLSQIKLHKLLLFNIVFISSFGARCNFSTELPLALHGKDIPTFFHDQPIESEGEISPSAIHAIEGSKISIVNLSEEYASSARCLDELAKIMECKINKEQKVILVFNQVDPLEVRNLTGNFGEKFSKIEERFKDNVEKLQTWRNALMEAADLPGFVSDTIRYKSELVEQIVEAVLKILNANKFPRDVYNKDLVVKDVHIPPPTPPPRPNDFPQINYDAYLSFNVEDTRKTFISYLYTTLIQKQIKICIDDRNLIRGDEISPSVVKTIEGSRVAVVNLSKAYASSARCLDELVKIIECNNKSGQIVIPVFYGVQPSDVRNQTGDFGDEFSELEERFKDNEEKLQKWRSALKAVVDFPGFESHALRSDPLLAECVVEYILGRLNDNLDKDLVGVELYLKDIMPLLDNVSTIGVDSLGIWGFSGIGKTTIVKVIFNKISRHFDASFFIQNVRDLLSKLFEDGNLNVGIPIIGINSREKLRRKKFLVVFDDATYLEQIESSMRILDRLAPKSLIIITTRNEQILQSCGIKKIYELKKLVNADALKLLSRHAFGQDHPDIGYEELSSNVMRYAQSIPLALKVLGCFLSGRRKEEWESTINKLEGIPRTDIQKVLRISYDGLDDKEKNIFLQIACFHIDGDRDRAIELLDPADVSSTEGVIRILTHKCFITISDDNKIAMHNLLQEMGREIVSIGLGKRSRSRHYENNTVDSIGKMFVVTNFTLEILSSVIEQLSSDQQKPQYALVSMLLSFAAVSLSIVDLVYKVRKEKVVWKWRTRTFFPWFYYPSETHGHDKHFGNFQDIIGLVCAVCQCILTTISFSFVHLDIDNPIKISAWPIIFAAGLLYSEFIKK